MLKLHSLTITHKTDVNGVHLNLQNADEVRAVFDEIGKSVSEHSGAEHFQGVTVQPMIRRDGYELIIGGTQDPQFGPVMLFGTGGQLVETFHDSAVTLPPLNATLAQRLMERTRIYNALLGTRGRPPVELRQLKDTLIAFSDLLVEQPWIKECDVNPLLASPEGLLALDARILLHEPSTDIRNVTPPAIRPYPLQYAEEVVLKDHTVVTLRPIRLEDEPLMVRFHESLSDDSVRRRYFQLLHLRDRVDHDRLIQICFNDFDREVALVAERRMTDGRREILGVGRLSRDHRTSTAEFAMLINDPWQGRGLGHLLLDKLIRVGFDEGIHRIVGGILPDNWAMQALCQSLGFQLRHTVDEVRARLDLHRVTGVQRAEAAAVVDEARNALRQ